ncbi:hypothetical protein ABZ023_18320 [Streptomyces sp. NPDC006367]|uniref:hypothetical protein n=1 Tax=unclassified Streptomyces TaxID=2593676 RepID=UPI0033AB893B
MTAVLPELVTTAPITAVSAQAVASVPAPATIAELEALTGDHPQAHVVLLTPALAKQLLKRNTRNRNLRSHAVEGYARDIQSGAWMLNGEAIKLDVNGTVLDGQHRLHAVVKADTAVVTFVVTKLPAEAQDTMDSGMGRTTADALALADETNASTLSAVLRRVWEWQQGERKFARRRKPTVAESKALLAKHPEVRRSAEIAQRTRQAFPHIPQSALGTAHFLFNKIDPDECAWFFQRVGDGAELPAQHPILALRARVTSERAKEGSIPWGRHLAYLVFTWNAIREDRPLARLVVRQDSPVPAPK